jgi:transcription elongation factor GreB
VSKAFTRESDESGPEEIESVRPQLPPGARNYITRAGADRLRQRLNELLEKKSTATDGALPSEAKADQRRIDLEIRRLQAALSSVVVAEVPADQEKVAFGASVVVRYLNGAEEAYRIVGVDEADPAHDRISWLSPLAQALLNHRAGHKLLFTSPAGEQELTILKVRYDSE